MRKLTLLFLTACMTGTASLQAQQLVIPAPSPTQTVKQNFGLSSIELSYSRPGVKGRHIFGDLVPYGKVWRTGANAATTLQFGDDVTIGGKVIPAGKYGLLSIPGPDEWTLIITRQLDVTSPTAYKEDQDVVRVQAKPMALPWSIETFTIQFGTVKPDHCEIMLLWDKTAVVLPVETNIDSKIMAQIDKAMEGDDSNKPYFAAAFYYLENGKDLDKALNWFGQAIEKSPKAYWMWYQKARCLAKLGKKKEAIETAGKSMALAKEGGNPDYVALNEKLIASLK